MSDNDSDKPSDSEPEVAADIEEVEEADYYPMELDRFSNSKVISELVANLDGKQRAIKEKKHGLITSINVTVFYHDLRGSGWEHDIEDDQESFDVDADWTAKELEEYELLLKIEAAKEAKRKKQEYQRQLSQLRKEVAKDKNERAEKKRKYENLGNEEPAAKKAK
jgi:hypothetical protein